MKTLIKLAAFATLCFAAAPAVHADSKLDETRAAYRAACKEDMKKFCATAEKGHKGACLKQHVKELSKDCRDARKTFRQARKNADPKTPDKSDDADL